MTNEEKAKEIAQRYQIPCHGIGDCEFEAYQSALEAMEWKENDILDTICNWLMNNAHKYINSYGSASYENYQLVDDLRNNLKIK